MIKEHKKTISIIIITLCSIFFISSINLVESTIFAKKRIKVAVSILPQKKFIEEIAGKKVEVVTVIPPGYSPTNYSPSPREMSNLSDAKLYFSLGLPAEKAGILSKIRSFNQNIRVIRLDKRVFEKYSSRKFSSGSIDPHIWLSPRRVEYMIEIIKTNLAKLDKENKQIYKENAKVYKNKINKLDDYIHNNLNSLNKDTFIIYHPVLGYFAKDYNLNMVVIEKEGKKAAPRHIQEIIDLGHERKIKSVFYQKTVTSRQAEMIAEELGGKTIKIDPFSLNYIENMKKITYLLKKYLK